MNAGSLELVIQAAVDHEIHNDGEWDAILAAQEDLAAMRQKITAEALVQAGWKESARPTVRRRGVVIFRNKDCSGIAAVGVFENGEIVGDFEIEAAGFLCRNVTTMYQLGQLVELLGGQEK